MKSSLGAHLLRAEIKRRGRGAVRAIASEAKQDAGQVSRWANEEATPEMRGRAALEDLLGIGVRTWDEPPPADERVAVEGVDAAVIPPAPVEPDEAPDSEDSRDLSKPAASA